MSNLIEKAKATIVEAMAYRFPKYPVCFENIEGDPYVLGVGVFAVPLTELGNVQDYVFGLESSCNVPDGWELLPLVRDPVATRTYYPDILVPGPFATLCGIASSITAITGHASSLKRTQISIEDILRSVALSPTEWEHEPAACAHETTTPPQDFAFAA